MATSPTGLMKVLTRPTYFQYYLNRTPAKASSMSGHYKTKDNTGTPYYTFKFATHDGFKYSTETGLRPFIEDLYARTGTENEELIALFDDDTSTYDLTTYNGVLTETQQGELKVIEAGNSYSVSLPHPYVEINTENVSGTVEAGLLFKKGDFLQPRGLGDNYRYPYQVIQDVSYTENANIGVMVNRPIVSQTGVIFANTNAGPGYSGGVACGKNVRFTTKVTKLPTYSIVPHDRVQFNGDFELVEVII
jgi:hypothetical protein